MGLRHPVSGDCVFSHKKGGRWRINAAIVYTENKNTQNTQINLNVTSSGNPRSTSKQSSKPCTGLQYPSGKEVEDKCSNGLHSKPLCAESYQQLYEKMY